MQLELKDLTKKYGGMTALDYISVKFTPGIYGILGANGAGKSTMMNLLTDNISRTNGEILFDGVDILKLGKDFRRVLGYMPQQQGFYEHMTAQTFLYYIAELKAVPKKQAKTEIENLLSITNLANVHHKRVGGFSGGMKQRVLLAQALLGDPKERIRIRNFISEISNDRIILLATHIVSDIESISDQILMMKSGHIVGMDTPENLLDSVRGKVTELPFDGDTASLQECYKVGNVRKRHGQVWVRLVGDNLPEGGEYVTEHLTLDDVYLYYLGE